MRIFRVLNSVLRLLYEDEQPQNTCWPVLYRIMIVLVLSAVKELRLQRKVIWRTHLVFVFGDEIPHLLCVICWLSSNIASSNYAKGNFLRRFIKLVISKRNRKVISGSLIRKPQQKVFKQNRDKFFLRVCLFKSLQAIRHTLIRFPMLKKENLVSENMEIEFCQVCAVIVLLSTSYQSTRVFHMLLH